MVNPSKNECVVLGIRLETPEVEEKLLEWICELYSCHVCVARRMICRQAVLCLQTFILRLALAG